MEMQKFVDGLAIFAPYQKAGKSFWGGAEHDQFFVYPTERPMSAGDVEKVVALGWFQEDVETTGEEDFEAKHYDPAESWAAYF